MTTTLEKLQKQVQASIIRGGPAALAHVRQTPGKSTEEMFGVYQNAYWLRLVEILGNDHPKLKCFMGDEEFTRLGKAYVEAHPSATPNARWFSRHLPGFVRSAWPWSRRPELGDLALLEQALNNAFDAPEAAIVTSAKLAELDPERFGDAVFQLHPSMIRFALQTNATSIWSSMKCGERQPEAQKLKELQQILVWRQGSSARFRMLGAEETMALDEAAKGVPFGVLCEMIAISGDAETAAARAASYLRGWIEAEIISAAVIPAK